jgi:hypothetical protein
LPNDRVGGSDYRYLATLRYVTWIQTEIRLYRIDSVARTKVEQNCMLAIDTANV